MIQEPFAFNGVQVDPGTTYTGKLDLLVLADGQALSAPIVIVHGAHPGPKVFIGGGVHGDEINGVRTAIQAVRSIAPEELAGTVLCIPVQNPLGYRNRSRLFAFHMNEQDRKPNLHQAFPGDAMGEPTERIAHRILNEVILGAGCSFVFDLHTGTKSFFCSLHSFAPPATFGQTADQACAAAEVVDLGLLVQTSEGVYAARDMPHMVCADQGIPVLGLELGAGGRYEPETVDRATIGIVNVLRLLEMLPGPPPAKVSQTVLSEVVWVRSDYGGLFRPQIELGAEVSEGERIAEVLNLFGDVEGYITSPVSGHIITLLGIPTINEGEPVARIGVAHEL